MTSHLCEHNRAPKDCIKCIVQAPQQNQCCTYCAGFISTKAGDGKINTTPYCQYLACECHVARVGGSSLHAFPHQKQCTKPCGHSSCDPIAYPAPHQNEAEWGMAALTDIYEREGLLGIQQHVRQNFVPRTQPTLNEAKYYQKDHVHCWESKKPPCGQKIEHLKCCLCEILNPKVVSRTQIAEVVDVDGLAELIVIDYANMSGRDDNRPEVRAAARAVLEALKAKLINPNKHD